MHTPRIYVDADLAPNTTVTIEGRQAPSPPERAATQSG
jgi:hypothetical protein